MISINSFQTIGTVFSLIVGSLLHFTYKWSGGNKFVALFSAVNESTWEHLKLLITPVLLFSIVEYLFYGRYVENFLPVKVLSIILGMIVILTLFYTYVGIVGNNYLWADILTFILGVGMTYSFSRRFLDTNFLASDGASIIALVLLVLLLMGMFVFTYNPPNLGLFREKQ